MLLGRLRGTVLPGQEVLAQQPAEGEDDEPSSESDSLKIERFEK